MMTAMAAAHSSSMALDLDNLGPSSIPPSTSSRTAASWEDEVVPALRARLEAESVKLGRRISRLDAAAAMAPNGADAWAPLGAGGSRSAILSEQQQQQRSTTGPVASSSASSSSRSGDVEAARQRARTLARERSSIRGSKEAELAQTTDQQMFEAMEARRDRTSVGSSTVSSASRSRTVSTPYAMTGGVPSRRTQRDGEWSKQSNGSGGGDPSLIPAPSEPGAYHQPREQGKPAPRRAASGKDLRTSAAQPYHREAPHQDRDGPPLSRSASMLKTQQPSSPRHAQQSQQQQRQARSGSQNTPVSTPRKSAMAAAKAPQGRDTPPTQDAFSLAEFGPLGGASPSRRREMSEARSEPGLTRSHSSSAWDEVLPPAVARRVAQEKLLAEGTPEDSLIDTWDRAGLPLSKSQRAMRAYAAESERLREQSAPPDLGRDEIMTMEELQGGKAAPHRQPSAQSQGLFYPPQPQQQAQTATSTAVQHQKKKPAQQDDVKAGCCKCSIM